VKKALFLVLNCLFLTSCAIGPVHGILFTSNRFAGETNPEGDVASVKTARGCQTQILGMAATGNSGAGQIAYNAGIKRIATIDHSTVSILMFVFSRYCTIVTGE